MTWDLINDIAFKFNGVLFIAPLWQRTFKKITHLKKNIQSALILGPNHRTKFFFQSALNLGALRTLRTLKKKFQSALRVYINITFDVDF